MNYRIVYHKKVEKFLAKCDITIARDFFLITQEIAQNPISSKYDIKPLKNMPPNHYRLRIRNVRFLYEIKKEELVIYMFNAGKRGDIYKRY